jgi:hypothetical protein
MHEGPGKKVEEGVVRGGASVVVVIVLVHAPADGPTGELPIVASHVSPEETDVGVYL